MADDDNGLTLKEIQEVVRDALERSTKRHNRWRAYEALYRTGSLAAAKEAEAGKVFGENFDLAYEVVNMTLPHINVVIASVVANDPKLLVVPIGGGPAAEDHAITAEGVLDFYWKRNKATQPLRTATQDATNLGNGFLKTGWAWGEEVGELDEDEFAEVLSQELEIADVRNELGDDIGIDQILAGIDSSSQQVHGDEPWLEYVSPYDIFVPPDAQEIEKVRWVCQRVTLGLEEVRENPTFDTDNLVTDSMWADSAGEFTPAEWKRRADAERTGFQGKPFDTVTYFEFYDMVDRRLVVFQIDGEEPLYDEPLWYSHPYPPFVHIRGYRPSGTEFWGFGDIENIANVQQMLNELFTMQMRNARKAGNLYFIDEEYVNDSTKGGIEGDTGDRMVSVKPTQNKLLRDIVYHVQREGLSPDVYSAKQDVEDYMQRVLGINDFQAGGVGADRMSATAAAVVDAVASLRAVDKVASVERAASEAGQQILLLCQEFLEEPRAIRISGEVGATWPYVDQSDIRGEFLVHVEGGSTKEVNPVTRENRGLRLLNEVAPRIAELGFDPLPAVRMAIRELGFDPEVIMQQPTGQMGGMPGQGQVPGAEEGGPIPGFGEQALDAPAAGPFMRGGPPEALEAQLGGQPLV